MAMDYDEVEWPPSSETMRALWSKIRRAGFQGRMMPPCVRYTADGKPERVWGFEVRTRRYYGFPIIRASRCVPVNFIDRYGPKITGDIIVGRVRAAFDEVHAKVERKAMGGRA